jgi:ribosomal protein L11 methylase PrmA
MVRPGGQVVLSGILASQSDDLLQGFAPWFEECEAFFQEGWACLIMQRRPAV